MKNLILLASILIGSNSFAATLQCWKTNFTQVRTPFMSATIEDHHILSNVRFHYKNDGVVPLAPKGEIEGEMITTNRSPYKGMNDFDITVSFLGMHRLILPADLSNSNLKKSVKYGENGVIIGSTEGDSAGSHFSVRLICQSDL